MNYTDFLRLVNNTAAALINEPNIASIVTVLLSPVAGTAVFVLLLFVLLVLFVIFVLLVMIIILSL